MHERRSNHTYYKSMADHGILQQFKFPWKFKFTPRNTIVYNQEETWKPPKTGEDIPSQNIICHPYGNCLPSGWISSIGTTKNPSFFLLQVCSLKLTFPRCLLSVIFHLCLQISSLLFTHDVLPKHIFLISQMNEKGCQ